MKFKGFVRKLKSGKAMLAVLIDPDKFNPELIKLADKNRVNCFLVGGSELKSGDVQKTIKTIKQLSRIPVFLFPGDENQLCALADGLLLLSLLSGRKAEYLIEKHIQAAPLIKKMKLPHLPVAYLLVGSNAASATAKVTGTSPLKTAQRKYIVDTALAAQQLGFGAVYLEAGSGAAKPVTANLVRLIKKNVSLPLIVGGGINSAARVEAAIEAGADMVVVGNALEQNMHLLPSICKALDAVKKQ